VKSNEPSPIIQAGDFWVYGYQPQIGLVDPIQAEYIISSGSLIAATTIKIVGPMLGKLFIDWVDVEWGQRAQKKGYRNFVLPTIVMRHSIGDDFVRLGNKVINLHSDLRNFYIVRNAAYLVFHYRFQLAWQITVLLKLPIYIFFFTLHAKCSKIQALKVLASAFVYGLVGQLGPAPNNLFTRSSKQLG
jgi:rhamnosyltransferase